MKKEKYILYGASFNPPHIGHFSAITQMLEEYDKIIVFPYPQKEVDKITYNAPTLTQRMKMVGVFFSDFFPQISSRLMLINLFKEAEKNNVKVEHTYDYLNFIKNRLPPDAELSVCLGFDSTFVLRKEKFYNEEKIKSEFNYFYLQEENTIKSEDLREFFSSHKNVKSKKNEEYIKNTVGNSLAQYIFQKNLYGVDKKTISNKIVPLKTSIFKPRK